MATKQPETAIDLELLAHIAGIAEVFNSDAAADEQLAGQTLQLGGGAPNDPGGNNLGSGASVLSADLFPHLRVINKDKPHGARRITSRTWKCDPYLGKLAHEVIMSSTSMAQLLQHSDVLRALRKTRQRVADEPCLALEDDNTERNKAPV